MLSSSVVGDRNIHFDKNKREKTGEDYILCFQLNNIGKEGKVGEGFLEHKTKPRLSYCFTEYFLNEVDLKMKRNHIFPFLTILKC